MSDTPKIQEYRVTAPDGHVIVLSGPAGASDEEVLKQAQTLYQPTNANAEPYQSPVYPGGPQSRTAGEVMSDQAANVLTGIPQAVTGIPGAVAGMGNLVWQALKGNARGVVSGMEGMVQPVAPIVSTLAGNPPSPESPEWAQAAQGAGANLGAIGVGEVLPYVGRGVKAGARAVLPTSEALQEMANANKARVLSPTTLQGRADAGVIAGEMSQKGQASGLRGKTIDANIVAEHQANIEQLNKVEARLTQEARPEFQVGKRDILSEIDGAKAKLNIPRTSVTARPEAIAQLNDIRSIVDKLPDFIDFDQLIELRRQLDARAEEAGAFGVNADSLKADLNRGVADVVRGKLNDMDPALKIANHDYSVSRKAVDMVRRRELGETGKINSGLPGRGGILDDVLATWAGQAMGGPVGAAAAEAINLGRQTRGYANVKGSLQQKLADFMRQPVAQPHGLLGEGVRQMPAPETSAVSGVQAEMAKRSRLALPPASDVIDVTGTIQPSSGTAFEMPGVPPRQLTSGRLMIPEKAGSPYITPLHESALDELRRKAGKRRR